MTLFIGSSTPARRFWHLSLILIAASAVSAQTVGNWTLQSPASSPSARSGHAMVYDPAHGQTVLFGGYDGGYLSDTWVWDGATWTQKSPAKSPTARLGHTMVYDTARGQVVLFGGGAAAGYLNDTWVWDGSNWTQKSPANSPAARWVQGMAYDAAHSQTVLFGGYGNQADVFLNDTWVWDGTNWTQKSPVTNPPGRDRVSLAFDAIHSQIVMFGGLGTGTVPLGDTWIWDGTNWTQKSSPTSPAARENTSLVYDAAHGQVLLFAGLGGTDFADTWTWDGASWTQLSPASSPSLRSWMAETYDAGHQQVVLFGGGHVPAYYGDTWTWTGASATALPAISNVISLSGFGGFSTVAPGSWVEIYGVRLAPDTRLWAGGDFNGSTAPTALDGTQVTIGGVKAFVEYISPTQVDVQVPATVATGGTLAVVVTNGTVNSAPTYINVAPTAPGLLAPSSFIISGKQYVVGVLSDGSYAIPAGAIAGVGSRPARPGESVVLYGVGFGTVTPAFAAGQIVSATNSLTQSLQMAIGGAAASTAGYAGLSPNYVGLYQFNVTVPSVADNNLAPLTFTLGGTAGAQTLYIAVHQ